ncbi:hypothetical protein J4425_02775 [Candidatus Woesearchaeota archaeon]|nr:hypothetical protein [Candidatus Woesearchaeota archaeon]
MSEESSEQTIYWVARIMIIFITIAFLLVIIGKVSMGEVKPYETGNYVLSSKIILGCLIYEDNFGTVDISKLDSLDDCINTDSGVIVSVAYNGVSEQKIINPDLADKESFCFDEESFYCNKEEFLVIVNDLSVNYEGRLIITEIKLK